MNWSRREKNRIQILLFTAAGSCGVGAICCVLLLWLSIPGKPVVTPEEHRYGLAENHAEIAAPYVAAAPPFQIRTADGRPVIQDNRNVNARLWEKTRPLTSPGKPAGEDWLNFPQEIGDCVSHGYCGAGDATLGVMAANENGITGPSRLSSLWVYFGSRVIIGGGQLGNSDGSVGEWAARFGEEWGLITVDDPGMPKYSGATAREWGRRGPQKELLKSLKEIAAGRKAMKREPARNATEAMDALANGYGVTIASSYFGTSQWRVQDGRRVAVDNLNWAHQQCVIGYDGSHPSGKRYFLVQNSWGADWGPEPMQGEPRGTYWITWEQMDSICREGDSWVITGINGLVEQKLDWSWIKSVTAKPRLKKAKEDHEERITTLPREWTTFPLPADAGLHNPFRAPGVRIRAAGGRPDQARLVHDRLKAVRTRDSVRARESDRASY